MIHKNELRIGNLTYIDGDREIYYKITQLKDKIVVVQGKRVLQVEYELLVAIPITDQLLEKYEFKGEVWKERKANDYLTLSVRKPNSFGAYPLVLMSETPNDFVMKNAANYMTDNKLSDKNAEKVLMKINSIQLPPIQYLHQLQNKFFEITGKELV